MRAWAWHWPSSTKSNIEVVGVVFECCKNAQCAIISSEKNVLNSPWRRRTDRSRLIHCETKKDILSQKPRNQGLFLAQTYRPRGRGFVSYHKFPILFRFSLSFMILSSVLNQVPQGSPLPMKVKKKYCWTAWGKSGFMCTRAVVAIKV